ncbi:MAG: NADH-quinone oxidoreductase subunit NuoG [Chloroflexi bacterium]|nr:NADH-quinone oxidoreductase subunit NuoG [Chloroflexota bacterium]
MADTVKIYIDDQAYDVPKGANLVDAAKWIGNDIPVFCYHPKMKPVGMCRMCLVEMGSINKDRATGEVLLDENGNPQIRWMPKMQTACTTTVSEGLVIRTATEKVADARKNVIEFLLTSHPLDCPICDKGGECPLQNQTLEYGPGASRMVFSDKMHLDKHVPLGDLIFLDEERCIQCARCIRFEEEIAGDNVLGFHERGRNLQIVTVSDPGFDSYFSGNTTDICPVGALTTEDFRFGARPWELTNVPSICPHCPVGCNISLSTRLDRDFEGRAMIKRVMPRQNEEVNEIWICDKGRFGHHFTRSSERLMQPMINGTATGWNEALAAVASALKAGGEVAAIAGTQMSNEDLWSLRKLVGEGRKGAWPPTHGGIELLAQVGVGKDTNLSNLGKGDAVLVIASDLEEEAPVWRLRIKGAHDRGAYVVVANARHTRMDEFASATLTYPVGQAAQALTDAANAEIVGKLTGAANLVIVAGAEGLTFDGSRALMQAAANTLISSGHVGKPNNGLLATLPGANSMGLHYMGFSPEAAEDIMQAPPSVLIVAQADIFADDPNAAAWLDKVDTIIALDLFPSELTERAKIALPIQSFAERDGSFTNGERRVQRFYTAQGPMGSALPAWQVFGRIGELLGQGRVKSSAAAVMMEIAQSVPAFAGARYSELAKVPRQIPDVGGNDLYYGGTAYKNTGGIGVQIATEADGGTAMAAGEVKLPATTKVTKGNLMVVPTIRLYNREATFEPSVEAILSTRTAAPYVEINAADAKKLKIADGDLVQVSVGTSTVQAKAHVNGAAPEGTVLLPRHLSDAATPLAAAPGEVRKV